MRFDHEEIAALRELGVPWEFIASLYDTTANSVRSTHYKHLRRPEYAAREREKRANDPEWAARERARNRRYDATWKGKARHARYAASINGWERDSNYSLTRMAKREAAMLGGLGRDGEAVGVMAEIEEAKARRRAAGHTPGQLAAFVRQHDRAGIPAFVGSIENERKRKEQATVACRVAAGLCAKCEAPRSAEEWYVCGACRG
jgi:hypothetical protein